ncbi:MAG TPA: ATP-binding protein, partial [Roseiflexaceae bacterium]|nr:ATP-binding protein [Roseiflexaceae bacterium]
MYSHYSWRSEEMHDSASFHSLDTLHFTIERFWRACDTDTVSPPSGPWRSAFNTAVVEIGGNIIRHACVGLPDIEIRLRLRWRPGIAVACFADLGRMYQAGFRPIITSQDYDVYDIPEGGMGLAIAQAALDQLQYRR